ncbi:MAG: hypothetical protein O2798_04985 [Chloroflexi bacterium]|nr:hypothetical protein [Chloroflexota bacterium]MDA1240182.1 hypothetical protein [Chloroflexota bacterium]
MATEQRTPPRAVAPSEHLIEACGPRVGDRRVRVPRRERGLLSRIVASVRRVVHSR